MPVIKYLSLAIAVAVLIYLFTRGPATDSHAIVVTASSTVRGARSCGDKLIRTDGIGALKLGMPADSLKAICPVVFDKVRQGPEGMIQRVMLVAFPPDAVEAEIVNDSVWRIDIESPAFKTRDSVGVGSPLREVLAHLVAAQGVTGEGNFAVVDRSDCGMSFILNGGIPSPSGRVWTKKDLATLPSARQVRRILVYRCPGRAAR